MKIITHNRIKNFRFEKLWQRIRYLNNSRSSDVFKDRSSFSNSSKFWLGLEPNLSYNIPFKELFLLDRFTIGW